MNRGSKVFWGIFFLLSAIFIIASQFTSFGEIGIWSLIGAVLLTAVLVHSLIHRNFFGVFMPIALLYMIFWEPLGLVEISFWILLASAILISIGFSFIFRARPPKIHTYCGNKETAFNQVVSNTDDNTPFEKVSFGSSTKYLHSNALKTGTFQVSFGAMEVYFDQAQLSPEGAEIYVDCSFGAIELYIPKHWRVKNNIQASLAGVENHNRFTNPDSNAPLLTLKGNVSLGSVEIKYI